MSDENPAQLIDARIKELGDWRGERRAIDFGADDVDEQAFVALVRAAAARNAGG